MMVGEVLTKSSRIICPHGGQALLSTSNMQVKNQNFEFLLESDIHTVIGCPFTIYGKYSPCVRIEWSLGSNKTSINGIAVLKKESLGLCYNAEGVPQGNANIISTQMDVKTQ